MAGGPVQVKKTDWSARRRKYAAIFITIAASIVLAAGSCFGTLVTASTNTSHAYNGVLTAMFFAAVAMFVGGVVWLIVQFIIDVTRHS